MNGAFWPVREARVDVRDRGLLLGDGIFETIRAEKGEPLHLERHLARLRAGAAFLEIPVSYSDLALHGAMRELASSNTAGAALRLTVTRGVAPRGLPLPEHASPICILSASPEPPPRPPLRLCIASVTRRNEHSPLSRLKTLNYLDGILARREAKQRGADDALLLNTQGRLAEATAACVFVRIGGQVFTPPVADGALPGIARALLLESGEAVEKSLGIDDLYGADGIFLANALGRTEVKDFDRS